ncbi:DnaJ subfamily C member 13 [Phytophthora cinnamomi]|uniref:DnaJ subfamily C member 13 n=1 Tax=Phytophthora cinnamomi TaxID=4785 RepID=UPI00355A2619|nr:DnaJ subfamily C member 13 [Phytophthora cinnamomi]
MALPRSDDSDAELQQLKQRLGPQVFGRDLAALDARFVPRGPETTGFEVEPRAGSSFYGALPAEAEDEEDEEEDADADALEVPANRFAGVIYAARFFVTRVGFLRSAKRLMVLSSGHLTVVDPYSDEVKERYAFDNIKEITIASDSGGHNADRAFTVFIGKSLKETYTCRCRQQLLSAYYQLRERASSFRKDEIDAATADALSAVGATADSSWATGSAGSGGGPSNANLLGSGMYFDSLFQLCGKTFTMTKLSTTRSIAIHPVKVDVLLAVRAASLDRLDPHTRSTLSSILLIDIVKIQRVNTNSNELVLYFENNRVHRYCVSLFVEEVSDSCEFDALTSTRDIPQPVTFEMPVLKISKNNKLQLRLLGLTALAIIERDPVTRKTMASHSLNDIFNVVIYPSISSSQDDPDSEISEGLSGKFALELKHGLTRRYICLSSTASRRDKDVSLGLQRASSQHENELRQIIGDIAGDINVPDWLKVAGATTLLSPKEARSLFLSNMIEMCRMNKLHVPWSTEETKIACKEGTWGTEVHPEWEDILLRKLVNLNFIPNLVTNESMSLIYHQLVQFNRNIPLGGLRQRDRRAFASLMKLLENFKEYSVAQLNSPSNTDAPIPTTEFQVELLLAIQRLLCTRGVFEEIPSSQYKNSIEVIMELLHSPMEEVSFAAACVIKYMVVNYSDTRSLKSETANRRAIFTKYHSRIYVSHRIWSWDYFGGRHLTIFHATMLCSCSIAR